MDVRIRNHWSIKAGSARVSFRVATKVDSRTILDANGAEALLGKGDMLYLPSGSARVHRLHAPFVTEKEIAAVVEFWKAQGLAEYQQQFLEAPKGEREAGAESNSGETSADGDAEDDPMSFQSTQRQHCRRQELRTFEIPETANLQPAGPGPASSGNNGRAR